MARLSSHRAGSVRGPKRFADRVFAVLVLAYLGALALAFLMLTALADRWWLATVLTYAPRWVLGLPLLALLPLSFRPGRARWVLPLLGGGALWLFGLVDFRVRGAFGTGAGSGGTALRPLRFVTYNIGEMAPPTAETLAGLLARLGADVGAFQECRLTTAQLAAQPGWYGHAESFLCVLSRHPFAKIDVRDPQDFWKRNGSACINRYEIAAPQRTVSLLVVHLETVREGLEALREQHLAGARELERNIVIRDEESAAAQAWALRGSAPLVVMGDFNLPVESAIYKRRWGALQNGFGRCGIGLGWSKRTRWFGLRIDHVLYDGQSRCINARLEDGLGGDHRPVVVDLIPATP